MKLRDVSVYENRIATQSDVAQLIVRMPHGAIDAFAGKVGVDINTLYDAACEILEECEKEDVE